MKIVYSWTVPPWLLAVRVLSWIFYQTRFVQYQYVACLVDTCRACLLFHHTLSQWWAIPIHDGCNCHQVAVKRGETSRYPFVIHRELLDGMSGDEQEKVLGIGGDPLLKSGLIVWDDIVTKTRVRDLAAVVATNRLTIDEMVSADVPTDAASAAYAEVQTPEVDAIDTI